MKINDRIEVTDRCCHGILCTKYHVLVDKMIVSGNDDVSGESQ